MSETERDALEHLQTCVSNLLDALVPLVDSGDVPNEITRRFAAAEAYLKESRFCLQTQDTRRLYSDAFHRGDHL